MALSAKVIETFSVNEVKNSIVMSEYLDQFIAENDKEPSWDGFIYIYEDKSKKKSSLKGRMPVQIKGKECNDHSKSEVSYSIQTVDLKNYLKDGGCVLFLVYIGNGGVTNKIYYIELPPIKLRNILMEAKEQKTKTLRLKEFPSDKNRKATIFFNCLQNCQKQSSFANGKLYSLDELEKQGILENIVIPISGIGLTDPQMALIKNEVYVYAQIKGTSVLQPLNLIPEKKMTEQVVEDEVSIGDLVFYDEYRVVKNEEGVSIVLGESFRIKMNSDNKRMDVTYTNSTKIRVLARDLEFYITWIKDAYFKLRGKEICFEKNELKKLNVNVEEEQKRLKYVKDIVKVLDILNCPYDIDYKELKPEDWRNIDRLINALIKGEKVKGLKKDIPLISCINIGKLRIALLFKQTEESGTYELYNYFEKEIPFVVKDVDTEKMLPVSQYYLLSKESILDLSNINFDILLSSFQKQEHHYRTYEIANLFLLELIKAYDDSYGARKKKILKTCIDFSDWISQAPEDEIDKDVKVINSLQIAKRYRELTDDEKRILYIMIENNKTREDCVVAAYLLLGQNQAAKMHFANLSSEEQETFKDYPVYYFWNEEE